MYESLIISGIVYFLCILSLVVFILYDKYKFDKWHKNYEKNCEINRKSWKKLEKKVER